MRNREKTLKKLVDLFRVFNHLPFVMKNKTNPTMEPNIKTPSVVLDAFLNEIEYSYRYARQATAPDWFEFAEREKIGLAYSVTSGSHPFNEWYLFAYHGQVVDAIRQFKSDSFNDEFYVSENQVYRTEDGDCAPLSSHELIECFYAESAF